MKIQSIFFITFHPLVNSIAWAPWEFGLKLAACSSDGWISTFTRNSDDIWENVEKFQAHDLGVNSVSWAPLLNFEELNVNQISLFSLLIFESKAQNQEKNKPILKLASASCDSSIKIWIYDWG